MDGFGSAAGRGYAGASRGDAGASSHGFAGKNRGAAVNRGAEGNRAYAGNRGFSGGERAFAGRQSSAPRAGGFSGSRGGRGVESRGFSLRMEASAVRTVADTLAADTSGSARSQWRRTRRQALSVPYRRPRSSLIEGPDLMSGAFLLGQSGWRPLLFVLSLLAICSRNAASTYQSTARDGKVQRNSGHDLFPAGSTTKKRNRLKGKRQSSALKGDRDDEISRKRPEAHSSSSPQPLQAISRGLLPAGIAPL